MTPDIRPLNSDVRDRDEELTQKYEKRKRRKKRAVIIIAAAITVIVTAAFLVHRFYKFSSCEMVSEKSIDEGSLVGVIRYADNALKYSHDGATYIDSSGKEIWVDSYEMRNPAAYVSGDYVCIADAGGKTVNIYNKDGLCGSAETVLPITKAVVSQSGVCAVITEDQLAGYISFYHRDGTQIDISIKSVLSDDGYPLDIALSPEGTQLIASYVYISGTATGTRVVFYDFSEIGKNIPNRLVGGFEEPFENSMAARVRFVNSVYSYAVSDKGICFFSSRNLASPELVRQIDAEGSIETIFNSGDDLGVITSPAGEKTLTVYDESGVVRMTLPVDFDYENVSGDGEYIYFSGKNGCNIFNMYGVRKFSSGISDEAGVITKGKFPGRFIFTGNDYIREYQFK